MEVTKDRAVVLVQDTMEVLVEALQIDTVVLVMRVESQLTGKVTLVVLQE